MTSLHVRDEELGDISDILVNSEDLLEQLLSQLLQLFVHLGQS